MKGKLKVCIGHPSLFSAFELERFEEEILANREATEHDASRFFAEHPKFLLLGSGKEIRRETVLVDTDKRPIGRVDFFRKTCGKKTWDIIELKRPQLDFFSGLDSKHPHLSSGVLHAVSQAQDYRQIIDESPSIRAALWQVGIQVRHPKMLVIAGRERSEIDPDQAAELIERIERMGVELLSYDDLFFFAKEHYESNHVIVIPESTAPSVAASLVSKLMKIKTGVIPPAELFDFAKEQFDQNALSTLLLDPVPDSVPVFVFRKDTSGRFTYVNKALADLLQADPKGILGKTDEAFYADKEEVDAYRAADLEVLNEGKFVEIQETFALPKGDGVKLWTTKMPLYDNTGKIVGLEGISRILPEEDKPSDKD